MFKVMHYSEKMLTHNILTNDNLAFISNIGIIQDLVGFNYKYGLKGL